ncbi:hypothetical protein [Cohnella herbarum]|uniref:Uncharacterized protein n=1 Tax=Cohnella herbarum TaxID=2728023 RepID=A0A7Z2VQK3_9BACL|nr:hypothetical protein [Cohnella herbarum]QJD87325.1 hypothetical protein HH215_31880 [Cohnella herbarum]
MKFSKFAGTSDSVSRLGFGAMGLGGTLGDSTEAADKESLPDDVFEELFRYHRWVRNFYDTKFW